MTVLKDINVILKLPLRVAVDHWTEMHGFDFGPGEPMCEINDDSVQSEIENWLGKFRLLSRQDQLTLLYDMFWDVEFDSNPKQLLAAA